MEIIHFKLKKEAEFAKKVINLKDELELIDSPIVLYLESKSNPLNELGVDSTIEKSEVVRYFDTNLVSYPKNFIDNYYEQVK